MGALVIEDEPETATFLRDGLRDQGWHVDVVGDGDRGLREAVTHLHDLLLLDVRLPGLDGWSVLNTGSGRRSDCAGNLFACAGPGRRPS